MLETNLEKLSEVKEALKVAYLDFLTVIAKTAG